MNPIIALLDFLLSTYALIVFLYVVMELLAYLNIINTNEPVVVRITKLLSDLTEPALRPIRRYIKPLNGFDFSPFILLIIIKFVQHCLLYYFA